MIIGAPQDLKGGSGEAYLFYGGEEIEFENSMKFLDESVPDYGSFGRVVCGLGDVNNDGYKDFGIMALDCIKVISSKTIKSLININKKTEWGHFVCISNGGDLDEDYFNDILISTEKVDSLITGGVLIYLGNSELNINPHYELAGPILPSSFGSSSTSCANLTGDKNSSIIIGDDQGDGTHGPGKVYIYSYGIGNRVEEKKELNYPENIKLNQNYPNPFNPETTIQFTLPEQGRVTLKIFDVMGREVTTLLDEERSAGPYTALWDGKDTFGRSVASGLYFYQIRFKDKVLTKKFTLMR